MTRSDPTAQHRGRGGARRGAGRPVRDDAGASHLKRPEVAGAVVVWWTARAGVPSLRDRALMRVIREAVESGKDRFGCSVVLCAVERDTLTLVCEAPDTEALSRSMQGMGIRVAKQLNVKLDRRGKLWADRFRQRQLAGSADLRALVAQGSWTQLSDASTKALRQVLASAKISRRIT